MNQHDELMSNPQYAAMFRLQTDEYLWQRQQLVNQRRRLYMGEERFHLDVDGSRD